MADDVKKYSVELKPKVRKQIDKLDAPVRKRIRRVFYLLKIILPALLRFHLSPASSKVAARSTRSRE